MALFSPRIFVICLSRSTATSSHSLCVLHYLSHCWAWRATNTVECVRQSVLFYVLLWRAPHNSFITFTNTLFFSFRSIRRNLLLKLISIQQNFVDFLSQQIFWIEVQCKRKEKDSSEGSKSSIYWVTLRAKFNRDYSNGATTWKFCDCGLYFK